MPKNEVAVDIFEYDDSESEIVAGLNALALTPSTSSELPSKRMSLMEQWNDYFKKGDLEDYQRLCVDLDLPGDLPSKTKCRQVSQAPKKIELVMLTVARRSRAYTSTSFNSWHVMISPTK